MTEAEYIIKTFSQHFSEYKDFNIALYGLGSNTENLIEKFKEFHFTALLDGYKREGEVYGMQILPIEKLLEYDTNIIVIVARAGSVKIIYKKISEFCKNNGIRVFDINGKNLAETETISTQNNLYFQIGEEKLKEEIRNHDVISFDLFDTLLTRKTLYPENVFWMAAIRAGVASKEAGIELVKERMQAEWKLANNNPTITEIYDEIKSHTGLSFKTVEMMMKMEIAVEQEVLFPRYKMVEILKYALEIGKKVYLVSDMYLPLNIIVSILQKWSISGFEDILVSCEYKTNKRQDLYRDFIEKANGSSYLHIGDNEEADGVYAKMNGIDSFLIKSASDIRDISSYREQFKEGGTEFGQTEIGIMTSSIFNNPFCLFKSDGRPVIKDAFQFGYAILAPILVNFVEWLIENLQNKKIKTILFIARDGYLIKELYDNAVEKMNLLGQVPESLYFHTSRTADAAAYIKTGEDIDYISSLSFDGTPEEMLKNRFFLNENEIQKYDAAYYVNTAEYVFAHKKNIINKSEKLRTQYLKYINRLGLDKNEKIVMFDFVSTGTCQMCLEKIMSQKLEGYYFIHLKEDYDKKQELNVSSYYDSSCILEQNNAVSENYFFLETVIKALEPSISGFDEDGRPVYLAECRNKQQLSAIYEIQRGILEYEKDYLNSSDSLRVFDTLSDDCIKENSCKANVETVDHILKLINNQYTKIQIDELANFAIRDEFCNRKIKVSENIS